MQLIHQTYQTIIILSNLTPVFEIYIVIFHVIVLQISLDFRELTFSSNSFILKEIIFLNIMEVYSHVKIQKSRCQQSVQQSLWSGRKGKRQESESDGLKPARTQYNDLFGGVRACS